MSRYQAMIHSEKADLRREMRLYLKQATDSVKTNSPAILDHLLAMDDFRCAWHSERLMSFVSMPLEVDTRPLFAERSMIVPHCENDEIIPIRIQSFDELAPAGTLKILEPKLTIRQDAARKVLPEQIDVVLVPGLAFDLEGNRLGRGKGYYDRFLRSLPPGTLTIGLALEAMIRDTVPHDENDCPVNMIVTECRVLETEFFRKSTNRERTRSKAY